MQNQDQPLNFDIKTTALILIDLQKGIASMPGSPNSSSSVVANSVKLADAFRSKNAMVVLVNVNRGKNNELWVDVPTDTPSMNKGQNPQAGWDELVPELKVQDSDILITKHQTGAFYGTALEVHLRRLGIKTIILAGIATHQGVESTARTAAELGYALIFAEDAMTAMTANQHDFMIQEIFPRIGRIRSTDEILREIE